MSEAVKRELAIGSIVSFFANGMGKAVVFVGYVFLARWLGIEAFGIFNLVFAITIFLSILSSLGLPMILLRFVAAYAAEDRWTDIRILIRRFIKLGLVSSGVIVVISAFVIAFVLDLDPTIEKPFLIGLLLIPLASLSIQRQQTLRALKHLIAYRVSENVVVYVALMLIGAVAWYLGMTSAIDGMVIRVIAGIIALVAGSCLLYRALKAHAAKSNEPEPAMKLGQLLSISLPLMLAFFADRVVGMVDVAFLGVLSTPEQTGMYTAAARVALMVSLAQAAINTIAAPLISESHQCGDDDAIKRILIWSCLASSLFGLSVCLCVWVFDDFILGLFGEAFLEAKILLFILLLGQLIMSIAGPVDFVLAMTSRERELSIAMSLGAIASVVLCPLLIMSYDALGAAIATATAIFIWKLTAFIIIWSKGLCCSRAQSGQVEGL